MNWNGHEHGMGIGGWLTNYKRFNVLPEEMRLRFTQGDWEHFDSYITESDVRYIAQLGMDHIRLGFDQIVIEEAPGVLRARTMARIDAFLDWCDRYGLHAVLNLHKAVGNYCDIVSPVQLLDDAALQDRFVALWRALEARYADRPTVAFELMNEVRGGDAAPWNALADRTIRAIRATNPVRQIVVGSAGWNAAGQLDQLTVWDDPNVIYTFHLYDPFEFTHQRGVLQTPCCFYNREMPYPGDIAYYRDFHRTVYGQEAYGAYARMDAQFLADRLAPAFRFAQAHPDKILWCGEFGTIRHCKLTYRENWMHDVIALLRAHGIPYCVWNYLSTPNDGNRFSLVDDDTRRILSPRLHEIIAGRV